MLSSSPVRGQNNGAAAAEGGRWCVFTVVIAFTVFMKPFRSLDVSFERLPSPTEEGTILRLQHMPTGVSVQRVTDSGQEAHQRRDMLVELAKLVREFQKSDDENPA